MLQKLALMAAKAATAAKAAGTVKTLMTGASLASSALTAYGQIRAGNEARAYGAQQQAAAIGEAQQMRYDATRVANATALNVGRISEDAQRTISEFQAGAATSGFAYGDQTSALIQSNMAAKKTMQQLIEQARGDDERNNLNYGATARELEGAYALQAGKRARNAAYLKAGATLLSAGRDARSRMGGATEAPTPGAVTPSFSTPNFGSTAGRSTIGFKSR